jgi:NAD(P)-dependent dehydrogenase (short-subunit alcohol dehydrogenase family)
MVITALGELGISLARRLGPGRVLVLSEGDKGKLDAAAQQLRDQGYEVHPLPTHVSDVASVRALAKLATSLGSLRAVIHAGSISLTHDTPEKIIAVDVLGTANLLDEFGKIAGPGSVGICIAPTATRAAALEKKEERALAFKSPRELAGLPLLNPATLDQTMARGIARRAIQLRVEKASIDWGYRGGRTVSISPGFLSGRMDEKATSDPTDEASQIMSSMDSSSVADLDHVVNAVEFLISKEAAFITGADLRLDGGHAPALRYQERQSPATDQRREVVVITGMGGMGIAIARELSKKNLLVLADISQKALDASSKTLQEEGFDVHPIQLDISDPQAVRGLAATASSLGRFRGLVHTAGVSPTQASTERIMAIDVMGTAYVLDEFGKIAGPGSVAVCIASMAGYMTKQLSPGSEQALATTPASELAALSELDPGQMVAGTAYGFAKHANHLRVEAASIEWGKKGGRVISISPGVILTPMTEEELASWHGIIMRLMIAFSGARRGGQPEEIAAIVAFLLSDKAPFISGTDWLVDGGVIAFMRSMGRGGIRAVLGAIFKTLARPVSQRLTK